MLERSYLKGRLELVDSIARSAWTSDYLEQIGLAATASISFLQSPEAASNLALDPYWPKWRSPWWHMLLLFELGLCQSIPRPVVDQYADLVDSHYLHYFPYKTENVPENLDPISHVACHCFLGSWLQVADTCGPTDMQRRAPWIFEWLLRYQNADGGLNCEEASYLKQMPTSSVVSTVPCVEAMLRFSDNPDYSDFIDRGMQYLLDRRLFRARSDQRVIDETWPTPAFPRFYFYDIMRGLKLTTAYSLKLKRKIRANQIIEAIQILDAGLGAQGFIQGRSNCLAAKTRMPSSKGQPFTTGHAAEGFELLALCDRVGEPNLWLTRNYVQVVKGLLRMLEDGLITLD